MTATTITATTPATDTEYVGEQLDVHERVIVAPAVGVFHPLPPEVVEMGPAEDIYRNPQHPYTKTLLSAVLSVDPQQRRLLWLRCIRPDARRSWSRFVLDRDGRLGGSQR